MKKVLIIEDSYAFSNVIAGLLQDKLNLNSDIAETSKDALTLLKENAGNYVAITTDLYLPDSPNGEIIELLKEFAIPSIVLTSNLTDRIREDVLACEIICDYLLKTSPGALDTAINQIKRLLNNPTINALIVDDSKSIQQLLSKTLKSHKINVFTVSSAQSALDLIQTQISIQLVVVDGELGCMNGIEITHELRKKYSIDDMVIIGISGAYSRDKSIQFIKSGANDFLLKPIVLEELIARININLNSYEHAKELKEVSQLQEKTLKITSHCIRNPLSNIYSLSKILIDSEQTDNLATPINLINKTSNELINLLHQLSEFVYASSIDLTLSTSIHSSHDIIAFNDKALLQLADSKQQQINIDKGENIAVTCDSEQLKEVINNLLSNAIKYSPENSTIELKAKTEKDNWQVTIFDSGDSIDKEKAEQLFDPFSTMTAAVATPSTGLGLAICQKLVYAHNGEIRYQTSPSDQGNSFIFSIPLT